MSALFEYGDLHSCAQHQEAKELANKLYARHRASCDKLHELVMADNFDEQRTTSCIVKSDKIETEFHNIMRGLAKCCSPFTEPCWTGEA